MRRDLEEASARAEGARQAHEVLTARLADLTRADQDARNARRLADQTATEASRAQSRAEANRNITSGKLESLHLAVARHEEEASAARARLKEAETATAELPDLASERESAESARVAVDTARADMLAARSEHEELRRAGEVRVRRSQEIGKEISDWRNRLETAEKRAAELSDRKAVSEEELVAAKAAPAQIAAERAKLADAIDTAELRRREAADRLAEGETALRVSVDAERSAERLASDTREARARTEALAEAARESVSAAAERIHEEQEVSPQDLLASLDADPERMPAAAAVEADVLRLRRQRDALGAVNLRAEEDAREVEDEHQKLSAEKTDLEAAIRTLRTGISNLNREGRERLVTAFDQVNASFGTLFTHLFGGGEAKLVMVESDDPLEAGLEIMCQPPGKKLSTLSLLSGGEQTLTALALIFAVFLANPAPICVLDEVDAPLDDANVTRFCDLLDEMTRRTGTRFMIITHHAITMSRMDRLFGVTMAELGVSQLVSVDLKKAEALVA